MPDEVTPLADPTGLYNYGPPVVVIGNTGGANPNTGVVVAPTGSSPHTPPSNWALVAVPGGSPTTEWLSVNDPTISTLTPATAASAGPRTVTVTGTNFKSNSVVEQDHVAVATVYVSATSLTATLQKATAGTAVITVRNPTGEQESNNATFTFT